MVNIIKRMRKLDERLLQIRTGTGAARLPPPSAKQPFVTAIHLTHPWGPGTFSPKFHGSRTFWRKILPRLKFYNPALPITVTHEKAQGNIKTGNVEGQGTTGETLLKETSSSSPSATTTGEDSKAPPPTEDSSNKKFIESSAEPLLTVHFDDTITSFEADTTYEDYIPTNSTVASSTSQDTPSPSIPTATTTRTTSLSLSHKTPLQIYTWLKSQTGLIDVTESAEDKKQRDELAAFKSKAEMDRRIVKKSMDAKKAHEEIMRKAKGDAERMRGENEA